MIDTHRLATRRWHTAAMVFVVLVTTSALLCACETPVFEYTMENWQRDPYLVRYFHRATEAPADQETNAWLQSVSRGQEGAANLSFARVDVTDAAALAGATERRIWEQHSGRELPFYAIVSPKGNELSVGALSASDAKALVGSPGRTRLAEQLASGTHGALLLVVGANMDENEAARAAVRQVVKSTGEQERAVGAVEVRRDDPAESWFVRQLMALEPDLADLANAMVFPVFGRGHVMEPYLGKGITVANLKQVAEFMNGPCACEVKTASVGTDLLTDFDWETRRQVGTSEATSPNFALFDIREAENRQPVVVMPTAGARSAPARDEQPASEAPAAVVPPVAQEQEATPPAPVAPEAETGAALEEPPAPEPSHDPYLPMASAPAEPAYEAPVAAVPASVLDVAAPAVGEARLATEERALASGPDLIAACRPVPAALIGEEASAPLGDTLSIRLAIVIAVVTLVILMGGMALVLRRENG